MSLNKIGGGRQKDKSKSIKIQLPRSNPNIKADIDAELDDGWHIEGITYLGETLDQILVIFTKPKRN
jgi:hypothetical protein